MEHLHHHRPARAHLRRRGTQRRVPSRVGVLGVAAQHGGADDCSLTVQRSHNRGRKRLAHCDFRLRNSPVVRLGAKWSDVPILSARQREARLEMRRSLLAADARAGGTSLGPRPRSVPSRHFPESLVAASMSVSAADRGCSKGKVSRRETSVFTRYITTGAAPAAARATRPCPTSTMIGLGDLAQGPPRTTGW